MRGKGLLLLLLLLAGEVFSSYFVSWSQGDVESCVASIDNQIEAAYNQCMSNCNLEIIGGFILSPVVRQICKNNCNDNILEESIDPFQYGRCKAFCLEDYANEQYGYCYTSCKDNADQGACTSNCYKNTAVYASFKECWNSCRQEFESGRDLSARDKGYIRCSDYFSFDIEETEGTGLYLPFESASGLSITAVWYYPGGTYHGAIDYDFSGTGTYNVTSASDGTVNFVNNSIYCVKHPNPGADNYDENCEGSGYGSHIMIDFTDPSTNRNYTILYGHLRGGSIPFNVGDYVNAGDVVGVMGNTGNSQSSSSDGTHLHFEIRDRDNGNADVNPYDLDPNATISEYPLGDNGNECGDESLWAECPPAPAP